MVINAQSPSNDRDLEDRLFRRMENEFGKNGEYSVKMLKTAKILLRIRDEAPYIATAAAYCIRQAIDTIFLTEYYDQERWKKISDQIVGAYTNIGDITNPTSDELARLFSAMRELKAFKVVGGKQKAKIIKFIERKSGDPSKNAYLVTAYDDLVKKLNKVVHKVDGDGIHDATTIYNYYIRSIDTLTNIILPFWFNDIEQLAKKDKPCESDAVSLNKFMGNYYDLAWFVSQMRSAEWFNLMDRDMLQPPSGGSTGLLPHILVHLKEEHLTAFVDLIEENWDEWTKYDAGLREMCHVASRLGTRGLPFITKALLDNPQSAQLCHFAWLSCRRIDAKNHWIIKMANILLNPDSALEYYKAKDIAEKLVDGMDLQSSTARINMLVLKLQKNQDAAFSRISRLDSIADSYERMPTVYTTLAANLCNALRKSHILGEPMSKIIRYIDPLPPDTRVRFLAWLYSNADGVDCSNILDFFVSSCLCYIPTTDAILLLERLERNCDTGIIASRLIEAIGIAPTLEELNIIVQQGKRHPRYRIITWAGVIGDGIELVGWEACLTILREHGISRDMLRRNLVVSTGTTSPFSQEEFDLTKPKDMAIKIAESTLISGGDLPRLSRYGIRSELEAAVKRNPDSWAKDPEEIVRILDRPVYIASYFSGLVDCEISLDPFADKLIRSIELADTCSHHALPLVPSPFYDDLNWQYSNIAGMILIKVLARSDVEFSEGTLSKAWMIVLNNVVGQADDRKESMPESQSDVEYYLSAFLNNPYPCALHVILFLIQYSRKKSRGVPEAVWETLGGSLLRADRTGAECRAVFATNINLLYSVLPDWMEQNESLLFGDEAPASMAKLSLDMHLMADNPNKDILERYRIGVLDAVRRDVDRAIDFLVQGMLWQIGGYDPESLAENIISEMESRHVSLAGKTVASMLESYADNDRIQLGIDFWKHILNLSREPEDLIGYGRWAYVTVINQTDWENLTLDTCKRTYGKIDFAGEVAERVSLPDSISDRGLQILTLLMRGGLEGLDREIVADHALDALNKPRDRVEIQESWNLLYNVMRENGYHHLTRSTTNDET